MSGRGEVGKVEALYRRGDRDKFKPFIQLLTKEAWTSAMAMFPENVRHHAANLAGHNWDVTLIGERLLISCAWSGGHWVTKDGARTQISDEEFDQLYPQIDYKVDQKAWYNATYSGSVKRQPDIVLEAASGIGAAASSETPND